MKTLKEDDKLDVIMESFLSLEGKKTSLENLDGENAGIQLFLLLPQYFQKNYVHDL